MSARILQFGTSRFLQAHADLFIHEARAGGQDVGPITVVKTTPGAERAGRVQALAGPLGIPVHIRGLEAGRPVATDITLRSVTRAYDASHDWPQIAEAFAQETEIVISNTGEAGYDPLPGDRRRPADAGTVPAGFPAKLLHLLCRRHDRGAAPLLILPCELVSDNGQVLRRVLEGLAADWGLDAAFADWLRDRVTICDTLVDRIVSQPLDPVGAVAEPYALWAIRRAPGMAAPFHHPSVVWTDDLTPFLRLKLHILNLGHTWLADEWLRSGGAPDATLRALLADPALRAGLLGLYADEVVPGFGARGMAEAAARYVDQTVERFDNPFLDHRIADIAQNHALKIDRRVGAFLAWVRDTGAAPPLPRLDALAATRIGA